MESIEYYEKHKDNLDFKYYIFLIQKDAYKRTRETKKITKWILVISILNLISMLLLMLLIAKEIII